MKKQLSKSDIVKLNSEINEQFGIDNFFNKKDRLIMVDEDNNKMIVKDVPYFFYEENKLIPTLKLLLQQNILKQVIVDMGAIKFVTSGADIMRPGIVDIDQSIEKDQLVVVVDETHKKPLCVAKAMFSGEEISNLEQGKVLRNLHWVGDKIWTLAI